MRKLIGIAALTGLVSCSAGYEGFIYEVTERSAKEVRIQTHKGALNMKPEEVAKMFTHMHGMATNVCREYGKSKAVFVRDRTYTTGAYYAWIEKIYSCS